MTETTAEILADWIRGEPERIARYFDVDDFAKEVIRNGVKKSRPAAIDAALRRARDRDGAEGGDAKAAPAPQDRQAQAEGIAHNPLNLKASS